MDLLEQGKLQRRRDRKFEAKMDQKLRLKNMLENEEILLERYMTAVGALNMHLDKNTKKRFNNCDMIIISFIYSVQVKRASACINAYRPNRPNRRSEPVENSSISSRSCYQKSYRPNTTWIFSSERTAKGSR